MTKIKLLAVVLLIFSSTAVAEEALQCPPCPDCPECPADEVKKDGWDLSAALGFNLTRGNSDTLLLTGGVTGTKEQGDNIYLLKADGALGEDKDRDDPETGSTTQKEAKGVAEYKHLLGERWYIGGVLNAVFDDIADIDYRYIVGVPVGYFLIKEDDMKLNLEAGPSYVFEKVGGKTNEYFSPRIADRFDWDISDTSKFFQSTEVLLSVEDGDDTLVNSEVGIEAAINSKLSLVLTVKHEFDNLPAEGRDRNDLSVISALKVAL